MTTQPAITIDGGSLARSIESAKTNPILRALATNLVLEKQQHFVTDDAHTFSLAVNEEARRLGVTGGFPMIGTAPGAVAALVTEYDDQDAIDAERTRLAADPNLNALVASQIAQMGVDYDAVVNTSTPAPLIVLLNAIETRVDVKNPVGMVLAFRDRVADYATVAQG